MKSKSSLKILMFTSIAVAFLFAFSPTALAVTASSGGVKATTPAVVNPTATSPLGNIVNSVRIPASPGTPQKGGGDTFVSNLEDGAVDVLNSAGKLVTEIEDGGASGYGVTYAPTTKLIYVNDYTDSLVYVINPSTMKVVTSYTCDGCIFGVYVPSNKMIYFTQFGYSEVIPFNPSTKTFGSEISVCGYYPEYIALGADGNLTTPARFNSDDEGCYSIIDPTTNAVTNTDLGTYPNGVACASTGTPLCWITDEDNGNVYEVQGTKLLHTISGCSGCEWGAAYNPTGKVVIVTSVDDWVYPITKGDKLGTAISDAYGSDANCLGVAKTIVVPLILSESPGYAAGVNKASLKSHTVAWSTELGSESDYPEGCGAS